MRTGKYKKSNIKVIDKDGNVYNSISLLNIVLKFFRAYPIEAEPAKRSSTLFIPGSFNMGVHI